MFWLAHCLTTFEHLGFGGGLVGHWQGCRESSDSPQQRGAERLALVRVGCDSHVRYWICPRSLCPQEVLIVAPVPNVVLV